MRNTCCKDNAGPELGERNEALSQFCSPGQNAYHGRKGEQEWLSLHPIQNKKDERGKSSLLTQAQIGLPELFVWLWWHSHRSAFTGSIKVYRISVGA